MASQALLNESNAEKATANGLFAKSAFKDAIESYDKALTTCPNYLDYEIAVLKSNIAACHLKLEDWKEAIKAATAAIDGLDRLQGRNNEDKGDAGDATKVEEEADEEIISDGAAKAEDTSDKAKKEADIERIRAKALMRRARARSEQGGWSSLQGAEEGMPFYARYMFSIADMEETTKHYHRCQTCQRQTGRSFNSSCFVCLRARKQLRRRRWER